MKAEKLIRIAMDNQVEIGTSNSTTAAITILDEAANNEDQPCDWVKNESIVLTVIEKD